MIPNAPAPVDTEMIVPHIAIGGGYATSFIFMANSAAPANVLLRTESPSGQPLPLVVK